MPASHLIFRRDGRIHVTSGDGRDRLAELVRSCARLEAVVAGDFLFSLSDTALWGAAARGLTASDLLHDLDRAAAAPIPAAVAAQVSDVMGRWGSLRVEESGGSTHVTARDAGLLRRLGLEPTYMQGRWSAAVPPDDLGSLKLAAMRAGWPVVDDRIRPSSTGRYDLTIELRPYQRRALGAFMRGGSGIILLPCGAGKTVVGVGAAAAVGGSTLVLTPSRTISDQWRDAFTRATTLGSDEIRANSRRLGTERVAIATYHAATSGRIAAAIAERSWDLVIYDEVQSLPADVFRLAASVQSVRRLGLTATLVREDGREREVSALVGPALYDASWMELEQQGWIAPARCVEVRIPSAPSATDRQRYRLAALKRLLTMHDGDPVVVAGTHVAGLRHAGRVLGFPVITGQSPPDERAALLQRFRLGQEPVIGISRIGTVGIDLPNAEVMVQLSGTYGSRQEEAQRLGRLLRPLEGKMATFYTLVIAGTSEEEYARRRQRFLVSQGYRYELLDAAALPRIADVSADLV